MKDVESIVGLLRELVRIPSRAGVDSYRPIADLASARPRVRGVASEQLLNKGETVGLFAVVEGMQPGPVYMLNATLDTAGFGDERRWSDMPTSGVIRENWMYGRGTADSKSGAAIFSHLTVEFTQRRESFQGALVLLLDLDEHTGGFAGVRSYLGNSRLPRPRGVYIGYPGNDRIVVGSRGFTRAALRVHGRRRTPAPATIAA